MTVQGIRLRGGVWLCVLIAAAPAYAQGLRCAFRDVLAITDVGGSGLYMKDDIGYLPSIGGGMLVADFSDVLNPVPLGTLDVGDGPRRVVVDGDTAYIASIYGSRMYVADVSDPTSPELLTTLYTPDDAFDITMKDGLVLLACETAGLLAIDVSDPTMPVIVEQLPLPGSARSIHVVGDRAAVAADDGGLHLVDCTSPLDLMLVSSVESLTSAKAVMMQADLCFVADGEQGLVVVDVSTPTAPVVRGALADLGTQVQDVVVEQNRAFVVASDVGLSIVDVTDPDHLTLQGRYEDLFEMLDLTFKDGLAVVVGSRVVVIDVSDPSPPATRGSVGSFHEPRDMVISGTNAYVADKVGLRIVDVSDVTDPTQSGLLNTSNRTQRVDVLQDIALLANGELGLMVVDVSSPEAPAILGELALPGVATDVVAFGTHAAVSHANAETLVSVIDVSDPTQPVVVATVVADDDAAELAISGPVLLVRGDRDVHIVDIDQPASPMIAGVVEGPVVGFRAIAIKDQLGYLGGFGSVGLYDLTDPAAPTILGSFVASARSIRLDAQEAYIKQSSSVRVYDVSDPSSPSLVGVYGDTNGVVVAVHDEIIYDFDRESVSELTTVDASDCCSADINGDGQLTILDFIAFQLAWQAQDPNADCDNNAVFNMLDFVCFQSLFQAGCP